MKSSCLYFVSQHFGRVSTAVYRDEHGEGIVEMFVEHVGLIMQFAFSCKAVARLSPDPALLDETLTRHAVAQAHKLRVTVLTSPKCRFELEIGNRPWIGDLLHAPYGGTTMGFAEGAKIGMSEDRVERRRDHSTYTLVERAIHLQRYAGQHAATAILIDHGIPQHVMLRVFSGAAFRRKD